jgi:hypothetical protein
MKSTGFTSCSTSERRISSGSAISRDVTVEITGICGRPICTRAIARANGSQAGRSSSLWNGAGTESRLACTPSRPQRATSSAVASRSPETTISSGELTLLSAANPGSPASSSASRARLANTETIAPGRVVPAMHAARAAAISTASSSEIAPAVTSAAYSPKL